MKPGRENIKILFFLSAAQVLLAFGGLSLGPLAPLIKQDLHLLDTQFGLFISLFYLGSAVTSLPSGNGVDKFGTKKILVLGQLTTGIGLIIFSFFSNYILLLLIIFVAGWGYSTINPVSTKAIMQWFPQDFQSLAMGIKQTGVNIGGALAAITLPALAILFSWREAILTCGLLIIISALVSHFFYNKKGLKEEAILENNKNKKFYYNKNLIIVSILCLVLALSQISLISYMVIFFYEDLNISLVIAGGFLLIAQIGGTIGRLTWGVLSDKFFKKNRFNTMLVISLLSAIGTLFMSLLTPDTPFFLIGLLVIILGFNAIGWNAMFFTIIGELAGKEQAGKATGLGLTFIFVGMIIGAPIFGLIVDISDSFFTAYRVYAIMLGFTALGFGFCSSFTKFNLINLR